MNEESKLFWLGFASAGVIYGYFVLDGHQAYKISNCNEEYLIQQAIDFINKNSYEELIKTKSSKLPMPVIRAIRDWRLNENPISPYPRQFYRDVMVGVEGMNTIGPISWATKRIVLRGLRKKLQEA